MQFVSVGLYVNKDCICVDVVTLMIQSISLIVDQDRNRECAGRPPEVEYGM